MEDNYTIHKGQLITQCFSDKKKIWIKLFLRLFLCLFFGFCLAGFIKGGGAVRDRGTLQFYLRIGILVLIAGLYVLSPLRHWKDTLFYYETAVAYNNRLYRISQDVRTRWITRYTLLGIQKKLGIGVREIDVTFIKNAEKEYLMAYQKQIDMMESERWIM